MYGSLLVGSNSSSVVRSTSRRSVFDMGKVGAVLFGEAIGSFVWLPCKFFCLEFLFLFFLFRVLSNSFVFCSWRLKPFSRFVMRRCSCVVLFSVSWSFSVALVMAAAVAAVAFMVSRAVILALRLLAAAVWIIISLWCFHRSTVVVHMI